MKFRELKNWEEFYFVDENGKKIEPCCRKSGQYCYRWTIAEYDDISNHVSDLLCYARIENDNAEVVQANKTDE